MAFDPARLLGMEPITTMQDLRVRDTMLYALGVGAEELPFVYEEALTALPTMASVLAYPGFIWARADLEVDWKRVLHGEQSTRIFKPLPAEGVLRGETHIEAVFDKGEAKGAIAKVVRDIYLQATGERLATIISNIFLRGNGGQGGSEGSPENPHQLPADRKADLEIVTPTASNQAMIYRLSGDYNPLHIDPTVARAGGFERPILQGLCTYGVVGRALLRALCDNDARRMTRIDARFSTPVYPGETIVTEIWRTSGATAGFRAKVRERDLVVLNNGYAEFS